MEEQKNRIALFIVAQNYAGKTTLTDAVLEAYPDSTPYSIREIIYQSYRAKYKTDLLHDRERIQEFSQKMKRSYGAPYFIEKALRQFAFSDARISIIESVRTPGEALWLRKTAREKFPHIKIILIALMAKQEDRYLRFLKGRKDTISPILTLEEFLRQEDLVNSGRRKWEENVDITMREADVTITNNDGDLERVKKEIQSMIHSYS